ncbi:MAG TPA: hypothetical protein VJK06_04205 [Methyloceanibacter sp.]|nr:hypothetical protein [Methyloceanibacter sp.]
MLKPVDIDALAERRAAEAKAEIRRMAMRAFREIDAMLGFKVGIHQPQPRAAKEGVGDTVIGLAALAAAILLATSEWLGWPLPY